MTSIKLSNKKTPTQCPAQKTPTHQKHMLTTTTTTTTT